MFLRSLTIRGFKSFANKSVLRFEPGITVIVGPNGSGKSNITDAVLWVLGEQSARTLRGVSMEDVIFAGSASKQALGTAEVSLSLDNSEGRIPIDFSEVTISRRLFRSGESEYMINRTPCRLIDIHEMLSDTGLGREMYSVISQGRLDDILNSKPRDRRQLLEEAAGVLKHKKRKERALRKLASMDTNLARGKDVLREVGRQLAPLRKQADQALQFNRLTTELKEAQVAGAVTGLRRLRSNWERLAGEQEAKATLAEQLKTELAAVQTGVAELESELEAKGILAGDIGEYRRHLEGLLERVNSGLLLLEEKGKNLVAKLSEFRQALHRFEARIKARTEEVESLTVEKQGIEGQLAGLYQELGEARREAEAVKKETRLAAQATFDSQARLSAERDMAAKVAAEINQANAGIESTEEKIAFLKEQLSAVGEKAAALEADKTTVAKEQAELARELPGLREELAAVKRDIDRLIEAKAAKASQSEKSAEEWREAQATRAALEALSAQADVDYSWIEGHRNELPELVGKLADGVSVQAKYEKAIEAVFGLDVNALVAKNLAEAITAYQTIRSKGGLPARILAADGPVKRAKGPDGLIWAPDVIKAADFAAPAVERLMANVWITDDMSAFLRSEVAVPEGGVVVDTNGDYIDSRGLIARQPSAREVLGSLATKRELTDALRRETELSRRHRALTDELAVITGELEEKQQAALAATAETQKLDGRIMTMALRVQGLDKELTGLAGQTVALIDSVSERERQADQDGKRVSALLERLAGLERGLGAFEASVKEKQDGFTSKTEAEKGVAARLSEAQIAMASLTERQTHLKSRLISAEEDLRQAVEALTEERKAIAATEELRLRIEPVHDLYTGLRLAAESWAERLGDKAGAEQTGAAAMREDLRARHQRTRDIATDLDLTNEALRAAEVAKAQVEVEVSQITKHLVDELHVALETALSMDDKGVAPEVYKEKEERLRGELSRLGPINQIAADEFAKLEERHQFLGKQIDDLTRSQKALQKVIDAIDKKIKARFQITFDEVNSHFAQVFSELFSGGTARLILVDGDTEDSEPGVDVEAQPHGKRLQSLSLLSGGERSLVGLALLFALYYARPSPFYILDEVEAALDDLNLQRFIRLLHKLKAQTQFLIITHQRRTMEIADSIYGVSMQADGISKVLSQKLTPEEVEDEKRAEAELVATAVGQPERVQGQS